MSACVCICSSKWTASFQYYYSLWPFTATDITHRIQFITEHLHTTRALIVDKRDLKKPQTNMSSQVEVTNLCSFLRYCEFVIMIPASPPRVCFAVPAAMPAAAADILPGFPVSRQTSWAGTDVDRPSLWLTSKLCLASSGRTRGEMEQLVLMKQLQDTNYYVNVLLLSSATANSLLHLEVQSLPCVSVHVCVCFLFS